MTRAVLINFCGDPINTEYWVKMYNQYISHQVDRAYVYTFYNPSTVSQKEIDYQEAIISSIKNVVVINGKEANPEYANNELLKIDFPEDTLLLMEADNFIFNETIIKKIFEQLDGDAVGIVAPIYNSILPADITKFLAKSGFMRCMMGVKTSLIKSIDVDLNPRRLLQGSRIGSTELKRDYDLDCFGYCIVQLLEKLRIANTEISYLPDHNLNTNYKELNYQHNPFIHVRQMSSSILGFGSGKFKLLAEKDEAVMKNIYDQSNNTAGHWQAAKAIAVRKIMVEVCKPTLSDEFMATYNNAISNLIEASKVKEELINEIYSFFLPMMNFE